MSWPDDAACRGADFDLFYPEQGEAPVEAMRMCVRCFVRSDCLSEALRIGGDAGGVWGGTSGKARMLIRRGQMTVERAMADGDRIAAARSPSERTVQDEPWLASTTAAPVPVRRRAS